jgi:phosphinothricin acetyltransferase
MDPGMSPRIRPAADDDFAAIAAMTNHYITTAIHFAYQPVSPDDLRAQWQRGAGRHPWLVAVEEDGEVDGEVIGYAKAGEWRSRDAYRWTAEVGIYIAAARRGAGVGRALYTALLDLLVAAGFRSAIGGITLPNPASIALHRALGFEHVGTVRDAGYKLGAWHDVAFYQRRLADGAAAPGGRDAT